MKILIATDGSEFSHEAIVKTCQILIDPNDVEIKIIAVYQHVLPLDTFPQSVEYSEELEKKDKSDAESFVDDAVKKINEYFPESSLRIENEVQTGAPDQVILEIAKDWGAEVIVVGTHGRGFWGRLTLGSVSDSVIHHAPCSVFVVRKTSAE